MTTTVTRRRPMTATSVRARLSSVNPLEFGKFVGAGSFVVTDDCSETPGSCDEEESEITLLNTGPE